MQMRKKIEVKEFQEIYKKRTLTSGITQLDDNSEAKFYCALDLEWFLIWKCFVTNDMTDKYVSNSKKSISQNKSIGVLPPGGITNENLFEKTKKQNKN